MYNHLILAYLQNRSFTKYHKSCPSKATKKELNHYDLALFFAPAQNVKNCIFSDAWGLMGRIVINLCLGVYFAKPEEEKYAARHYMFLTAGKRSATRE
jgi:hypothetical protein